jgi:hypothetical protein
MAKKSVRTDRGERLSSVVAGDTRRYGGGRVTRSDFAGNLQQGYSGGGLGMPVTNLGANVKRSKDQSRVPTQRSIGGMKAYGTAPGGTSARKYSQPIGPSNRGTVPGGAGIVALNDVRLRPVAAKPKTAASAVAAAKKVAAKPARKPTEINIPGGGLRTAKAKAPARMAVNPRTGSTLGFTSGSRTGSTVTKAGVAGKTSMTGMQRMSQNAFNKGGVAGPRKDSSGRNVSSASGKRK